MIIRRETWICDQCGKKFSFETSQENLQVIFSDWKNVEGKGLCCRECIAKLKATPKETPKYDRFPYPPFAKGSAPGIPGRVAPLPPVDNFPPMPPVKPPKAGRWFTVTPLNADGDPTGDSNRQIHTWVEIQASFLHYPLRLSAEEARDLWKELVKKLGLK